MILVYITEIVYGTIPTSWHIRIIIYSPFFKKEGWGVGKSIASLIFISNDLFRPSARKSGYSWRRLRLQSVGGPKGIAGMVNGVLVQIQKRRLPS